MSLKQDQLKDPQAIFDQVKKSKEYRILDLQNDIASISDFELKARARELLEKERIELLSLFPSDEDEL